MKSLLDRLVDNMSEINSKTCNKYKERTKTTQYCESVKLKESRRMYKCLDFEDISRKSINVLIEKFCNTYRSCNNDNEKFVLLLRKGVYPYEYMEDWNKFNENELPLNEEFYSNLNMSNKSDKEYEYAKKVWNTLNIKNLGEYHDLYVELDPALLADVFENFIKVCLIKCKLQPCYFLSVPAIAWTPMLKLTKVKLELLTDVHMLLMFGKGTRGGISQAVHKYATANNKYMKSFNKIFASTFLQYLEANNLYG